MEDYRTWYEEENVQPHLTQQLIIITPSPENENLVGAFVSGFFKGLWYIARIMLIIIIILIVLGVAL